MKTVAGAFLIIIPPLAWVWLAYVIFRNLYLQGANYRPMFGEALDDSALILFGAIALCCALIGKRMLKQPRNT